MPFTLRSAVPTDADFLFGLYSATQGQKLSLLPLPPPQLAAMVRMQFQAQRQGYRVQFIDSEEWIILNGQTPIGHVWLSSHGRNLRIVDIAILPSYQNLGAGTAILRQLIERADASRQRLSLSVQKDNPGARRLYAQLGFQELAQDERRVEMAWMRHKS